MGVSSMGMNSKVGMRLCGNRCCDDDGDNDEYDRDYYHNRNHHALVTKKAVYAPTLFLTHMDYACKLP